MSRFRFLVLAIFIFSIFGLASLARAAPIRSITMSSDQAHEAPRWMHQKTKLKSSSSLVNQLIELKKARLDKRFADCVSLAAKIKDSKEGLGAWIQTLRLECADLGVGARQVKTSQLASAIHTIEAHPDWLLWGGASRRLRSSYGAAMLKSLEFEIRSNRKTAWSLIDRLQKLGLDLNAEQRAQMLRWAGELAFLEQNMPLALSYFSRSLSEKDSTEVRKRFEALRVTLGAAGPAAAPPTKDLEAKGSTPNEMGLSADEKSLFARARQAFDSGDLLSSVEDGIKILQKFPGGEGAKWSSDRILEIYLTIASKSEDYKSLKSRALELMLKADASRSYRWAANALARGFYEDALVLAVGSAEAYGAHPEGVKSLTVAAHAAVHSGQLDQAEELYLKIATKFSGTDEFKQALVRLGIIKYRTKKFGEASAFFERVLALPSPGDYEYVALYWHWRSQQGLKSPEAMQWAEKLVQRYPLTYYGLRARAELNEGLISLKNLPSPLVKAEVWLTESQSRAWERFLVLLRAGWFDEAQSELAELPEPSTPEEKALRAQLLASAFNFYQSIRTFNEVWTLRPDLMTLTFVRAVFPTEFSDTVKRQAQSTGIDESTIWAVIRQESSFRTDVASPSNAIGLMQILPSTGKDIAGQWKPTLSFPQALQDPDVNVKIGSIYLSRLLRAFKGHLPLALAAYNAGIGRIRRWQSARKDLILLDGQLSSAPENETWIDELPWDETSLYVKAVLRNILIYRSLDKGEIRIEEPIWKLPN